MKALITGAGGFMGLHLIDLLKSQNVEVFSTYYNSLWNPKLLEQRGYAWELDVRDRRMFKTVLHYFRPDVVYHLAAQSYPTISWEKPNETMDINVNGTINLFESLRELKLNPVVMVAGSSAEYGFVNEEEVPVREDHELKPLHPYGVSKVAQEMLAYQYFKNFGMRAITIRIFNTTGPGKVNDVCSDFTRQIAMASMGRLDKITVGNLNTRRTITDVRDCVRAFYLATENCKPGEAYNMSGSSAYKVEDILHKAFVISGIEPEVLVNERLLRPTDEPIIYGDSSKLEKATGWKQEIPLVKTLEGMINFWNGKISRGEDERSHSQYYK